MRDNVHVSTQVTVNVKGTEVFMKPIEIERIVIPEFKILSACQWNDRQPETFAFILQENTYVIFPV
jgi:hypothetical protein